MIDEKETLVAYINEDLKYMTLKEVGKVYKFIRTKIIADLK